MSDSQKIAAFAMLFLGSWLVIFFSVTLLGSALALINEGQGNPQQNFMGTGVAMTEYLKAVSMWGMKGVNIAANPDIGLVDALCRIAFGMGWLWFMSRILASEASEEGGQMWYVKMACGTMAVVFLFCPSFRATLRFLWQIRSHSLGMTSLVLYFPLYCVFCVILWRLANCIGTYFLDRQ